MSSANPRPRKSATKAADYAAQFDLDDVEALPAGPLESWRLAAIREWERQLEAAVQEWDETPRMLDEADTGMPCGRILTAGG